MYFFKSKLKYQSEKKKLSSRKLSSIALCSTNTAIPEFYCTPNINFNLIPFPTAHSSLNSPFCFDRCTEAVIWYLIHSPAVHDFCLVQSFAKRKKTYLIWPWTLDDLVSATVKHPVVFLKSRTCPCCPLANFSGIEALARAIKPSDSLSPVRLH